MLKWQPFPNANLLRNPYHAAWVNDLGYPGSNLRGCNHHRSRFWLSGIGYTLFNAINSGDYNVIMGVTLFSIVGIATASLLVDLSYPLLDPRVRYR
jgi:hypothetical protein